MFPRLLSFLCFVASAITGLSGCTALAIDPHAGFPQVAQLVSERSDHAITWTPGPEENSPAIEAIAARLTDGLNETDAVQIALVQNRNLQARYTRLGIAQADLVQASLLHNPVMDLSSGFPVAGGVVDLSFGLAMDFIDLLYTPLRKRVAAAQFEETKLRTTAEVLEVVWQTQTAFYRHQANEQMLELRRHVALSTAASTELARALRQAGNIRELDLATELALAEETKLDVRLAEIAVHESRERLNILMGMEEKDAQHWRMASIRLPEPPHELLDLMQAETQAVERSLDLAAADQLIVAATENASLDRISGLLPEVILGGKGERDGADWEPGPTFTLPIPLFDRGQARVARAQAELRQARELRSALAVHIHAVARSTRERLAGQRDRALHYRDTVLPLQERILHEIQLQYNAMQVGPLELLRAKEQQIAAGVRYIETLQDYWLAQADLTLLLAGHLPPTEPTPPGPTLEQAPRFPFPTLR